MNWFKQSRRAHDEAPRAVWRKRRTSFRPVNSPWPLCGHHCRVRRRDDRLAGRDAAGQLDGSDMRTGPMMTHTAIYRPVPVFISIDTEHHLVRASLSSEVET